MKADAIVLAAGASSRMGRDKLALPYAGSTVLETVIRAVMASRVSSVTIVAGPNLPFAAPLAEALGAAVVENPRPEDGMASSARCAIERIPADSEAFMIVLGDQPQIRTVVLDSVIGAAETSHYGIVAPVSDGKRGHPVLFSARYRDEILALPTTVGLNEILRRHPEDILEVRVETSEILEDIDTPDDYDRALRILRSETEADSSAAT